MTPPMWSEEAVQAVATAMHPDCDRSACPAHEVWVHQAREALKAAEPYARAVGRREVSEEIAKAIELEHLTDNTETPEDEAYDLAIDDAANVARKIGDRKA